MGTMFDIMVKAIRLPLESKKLMLQVFTLSLFPFLFLVLLHSFIATPLIEKVEDNYENFSVNPQDNIALVINEIPFAVSFCLVLLFSCSFTVSASALTHQGTSTTLKEVLLTLKWKRVLAPWFYCLSLMAAFVAVTVILARLNTVASFFAALITYPYLGSLCTVMLIVSILDDGNEGEDVFKRSREIIAGRRFQGYRLMLILTLLSIPVYVLFYVTAIGDVDEIGLIVRFSFLFISTVLFCLSVFFQNVVFTLFYLSDKEMLGEKIEDEELRSIVYQSVSALASQES